MNTPPIIMYTDGSARGNPGPGGYGVVLMSGPHLKELAQGYRRTTNNRMELLAVIKGLEALKRPGQSVTVYSDSQYVVKAVEEGWLRNWIRIGFKGKKNADLWKRYHELSQLHSVRFVWVKGHADNAYNNRCDELATAAADGKGLQVDQGYESGAAG
ncbi:ribonuclease HI [Flaviaesturariibacter aridisoli]|nr:ribonuclease HI [Flaviaesturariibacter aridisoli]